MGYVPNITESRLNELGIPIMDSSVAKYKFGNNLGEMELLSSKSNISERYIALRMNRFLAGIVCPAERKTVEAMPERLITNGDLDLSIGIDELVQQLGIRIVSKRDFCKHIGSYLDRAVDCAVDNPRAYVGISMYDILNGILVPMSVGTKLIKEELANNS